MSLESTSVHIGLAKMLKGGVIMDVVNPDQAKLAEDAGACAVMALERIPSDIRRVGGVARMACVDLIESIKSSVSIPVMAKCRIGHVAEAQMLAAIGVDFIDESEVLTPADECYAIEKSKFSSPFVCGARDLPEALRRIAEGAAMIRTKGEAGTGNIVEAVRHMRAIQEAITDLKNDSKERMRAYAKQHGIAFDMLARVQSEGLPVVNFAAGGIATPADAALMMQLGAEGVFVGSGIFKSSNPAALAKAMVSAVTHFQDPAHLVAISRSLGEPMMGIQIADLSPKERFQDRETV
jgi:pyridoxal 5'-phosphate synthase pdxS subunit